MLQEIVLICIKHMKEERTVSGIYHLLTGKRSSQTMQDAKAYQLSSFFGVHKSLERHELTEVLQSLEEKEMIVTDELYARLTKKGALYLKQRDIQNQLSGFRGLDYHQVTPVLTKRLLLLIQTVTNLNGKKNSFVPIIDDAGVQAWVRGVYSSKRHQLESFVATLYEELNTVLEACSKREAYLFVCRLTGNGQVGSTYDQLADECHIKKWDVHLHLERVMHQMIHIVKADPSSFSALSLCLEGLGSSSLITESAKRTYYYVERGWTIEEIVQKRRLKESTIQDHIVEAALVLPDFRIESFVSLEGQSLIVTMARSLQTKRLKEIYLGLKEEFSYFQIRLTLAHHQHHSREESLHGSVN
ncbi:helix-turn-helix domain-containing protein [Halobacillus litoralis]|uniref:helix-turn-helix domain-containing protein n=1 Tax=Halobacillus litoralis TaxID=45668 RepID=UPI001CD5C714|nr:helix-turn-helix domain-containing protein [Halobacillus litoralis]MCA0970310.1 helix-turn-helix domain-containing protein [Halobacillus litoralis]